MHCRPCEFDRGQRARGDRRLRRRELREILRRNVIRFGEIGIVRDIGVAVRANLEGVFRRRRETGYAIGRRAVRHSDDSRIAVVRRSVHDGVTDCAWHGVPQQIDGVSAGNAAQIRRRWKLLLFKGREDDLLAVVGISESIVADRAHLHEVRFIRLESGERVRRLARVDG